MRTTDWLLLLLLSVLWGASFPFIAVAVQEIPPFTLVLARVTIAALVLLPVVYAVGKALPNSRAGWAPFVVQAILNNVIPFTLISMGQTRVAGALAAVLNATTPLFTIVVARVFAGDPLTGSKVAGVVLGIAGVVVLMGPEVGSANAASLIGMLCVLAGALSYGFSALWMRRLREIPPLVSAGAQLTCSAVLLLPLAALVDRFWQLPWPTGPAVASVLGVAVISTALAYIVFFRISATAGPSNVMLVTLLIPVTATAIGVWLLGERLTFNQVAGAAIIGSALIVIDGRLAARLRGATPSR